MSFEEIEPLNEDEEGILYLGPMAMPDIEGSADVIAEIISSDPNKVFELGWRNATIKMRAGSWAAIFQRDVL
jgi:hypothetical protein